MKKSGCTEEQVLGVLRERESGCALDCPRPWPKAGAWHWLVARYGAGRNAAGVFGAGGLT